MSTSKSCAHVNYTHTAQQHRHSLLIIIIAPELLLMACRRSLRRRGRIHLSAFRRVLVRRKERTLTHAHTQHLLSTTSSYDISFCDALVFPAYVRQLQHGNSQRACVLFRTRSVGLVGNFSVSILQYSRVPTSESWWQKTSSHSRLLLYPNNRLVHGFVIYEIDMAPYLSAHPARTPILTRKGTHICRSILVKLIFFSPGKSESMCMSNMRPNERWRWLNDCFCWWPRHDDHSLWGRVREWLAGFHAIQAFQW